MLLDGVRPSSPISLWSMPLALQAAIKRVIFYADLLAPRAAAGIGRPDSGKAVDSILLAAAAPSPPAEKPSARQDQARQSRPCGGAWHAGDCGRNNRTY
jgi:hypothetical protein